MPTIKITSLIVLCFCFSNLFGQLTQVKGTVKTALNAEGIHVINKSSNVFSVTNSNGRFEIPCKLNDTIVFSSIQHNKVLVVVDTLIIKTKQLNIELKPFINSLEEVVVGSLLSGDLFLDIKQVKGEPMTSKKAGIPSYRGKMPSPSQRRYNYARGGMLNSLINTINGNIKRYKRQIELERKAALIKKIRNEHEANLFANYSLDKSLRTDYFYFCSDDPEFLERCENQNSFRVLQFLVKKLKAYKKQSKH